MRKILEFINSRFGTREEKELARAEALLGQIRKEEKELASKSDSALKDLAAALRARAEREPLDNLLVSTFALGSEVASRTIGQRPYDVQVLGGVAIHRGNIAEMKTGEGKTLAAVLPVALNAFSRKGVHVVTVNDYLASRDANWMGPIYRFLGLSVAAVTEELDPATKRKARREAYGSDITYVTNHELVFDYLRDNLALSPDESVGRDLNFALVDEVDFLLLDEARTPLIISGPAEGDTRIYRVADRAVRLLKEGIHYQIEPKVRRAAFLDEGYDEIERALKLGGLANPENSEIRHALHSALLARAVYHRDIDYIVQAGQIIIVDEYTGRLSEGKRYADGLHQALEAKEGLRVRSEDLTLAKVTYQNYFRLYPKLAGMTGTAYSEREEFSHIYGLGVIRIPTNKPCIREDLDSLIFKTKKEKFHAVVNSVEQQRSIGRPILVGTASVQDTEELSRLLRKRKIRHQVLNAKLHAREAAIIAQAGRAATVTISTNMAGRGTDILLGGNPDFKQVGEPPRRPSDNEGEKRKVAEAGGLLVIGTEWHEARRIDDQLRGRSGRQGDPGSTQFFVSLDDPIYRKFGKAVLPDLQSYLAGHPAGEPITDRKVFSALKELREKVEVENKVIRREVFRYDLVIEEQRQHIYQQRRQFLQSSGDTHWAVILGWINEAVDEFLKRYFQDDTTLLGSRAKEWLGVDPFSSSDGNGPLRHLSTDEAGRLLKEFLNTRIDQFRQEVGRQAYSDLSMMVCLKTIDELWTEHLNQLESVDDGIGLRAYAQRDPLVEYKKEAGLLFQQLPEEIRLVAISRLARMSDWSRSSDEKFPEQKTVTRKGA